MTEEKPKKHWAERLVRFFKDLPGNRPQARQTDYSSWNQTEEEYQREQAEWLETVRRRKAEKEQQKKDNADRKGD